MKTNFITPQNNRIGSGVPHNNLILISVIDFFFNIEMVIYLSSFLYLTVKSMTSSDTVYDEVYHYIK